MGTWLVWVGSFGMRGADEAGCHRGDGSLVFYLLVSLIHWTLLACSILPHGGVQPHTLFLAKGRGSASIQHGRRKGRR